jgi:hypothetical protein
MGRDLAYSTAKARTRLGWRPAEGYRETIGRTVLWYLSASTSAGAGGSGLPRAPAGRPLESPRRPC